MSAPAEFLLPDLGEGLTEAELLSWSVAVGDTVELDQPLCEVETAKAVVELPAPFAGTVAALHAEPGATVVVGEKLVTIDDGGGSGTASSDAGLEVAADDAARPDSSATGEPPAAARADDAAPPTLVGSGPLPHRPGRAGWRRRSHGTPATSAGAGTGADTDAAGAIRAKPSARKAARERGVDITAVRPARADGVITEADVARRAGAGRDGIRTPADAFRRATAAAVSASARSVPHATAFRTADFTSAMSLLRRLRGDGADGEDRTEVRLSPLTLVAKAVLVALVRHPLVNASWAEDSADIIEHSRVNLGVAVAGPHGLSVPHIRAAESLGLSGLASALDELVDEARAGRTPPARLRGGTFTITNIGVFGLEAGTAVINPGEAAILSLGAVERRPWVHDDHLVIREVATLGLSFDHRLIDGELAGRFLATVAQSIENPLGLAG